MRYGIPLISSLLSQWILNVSDRYMIQFLRGSFEVGIYSVGYDISHKAIYLFMNPFIMSLTPTIINSWEKNRRSSELALQQLSRYFLMICLPALIGFNSISKQLIYILTSPPYYNCQLIIPFVSTGVFFMGLYAVSYTGLIIHEKTILIAKIITISSVLNILLNFLFIPYYGFLGAGFSTMIAYFVAFLISNKISSKYLKWKPQLKSIIKIFLASTIMGIIVYYIVNNLTSSNVLNLILAICSGMFIYFILLFLLKEIELIEAKKLLAIILKR